MFGIAGLVIAGGDVEGVESRGLKRRFWPGRLLCRVANRCEYVITVVQA